MAKASTLDNLLNELQRYKRKYYLNQLLKGSLVTVALLLIAYISVNTIEYLGRFGSDVRAVLFFTFIAAAIISFSLWIVRPLAKLLNLNRQLSDEEAAQQIGAHFPEIDDKLLNAIQLNRLSNQDNALVQASIAQRSRELEVVRFTDAINLGENRKYLRYILIPLLLLLLVFFASPSLFSELFTQSAARILNFNTEYEEPLPFTFELANEQLQAFKNEDFEVNLKVDGRAIPQEVFMVSGGRRYKMRPLASGEFSYNFPKIQRDTKFYFEAAGYDSKQYQIEIIERPALLSFNAALVYPAYLGKAPETWSNIGNLVVPEGTKIRWEFKTNQAESLKLRFSGDKKATKARKINDKNFSYERSLRRSERYQIKLRNQYSENKEEISYYINVVPDQYPKISMKEYQDTTVYRFISLGGDISDDYGLSQLRLSYRVVRHKGNPEAFKSINLKVAPEQTIQNFYQEIDLEPLNLKPGDRVEYFAQVWDNDGVNGAKSSKTTMQQFQIPDRQALKKEIDASNAKTEKQIDQTLDKAKSLKKDIKDLENKLQQKNKLDYQDRKKAEDIIKKREELRKEVEKLREQNNLNNEKKERFGEKDEKIAEKMEQLQKLMDELLDEETKKLYDELKKLLEENRNNDAVKEKLDEISQKEETLEQELERALEMFKQLQFEQKLEETAKEMEELGKEQEELGEQTENKEISEEESKAKQEELNEKFEELKEEMQKLEELDKELENPNGMEEMNEENKEEMQEISEDMENIEQQLDKKQQKKAGKSQQETGKKMQKMGQKMQEMMESMESEQMEEDMNNLRAILENLVKLSFDQEQLMQDFRGVNLSDPRFIELAQKQVKLQDDAKIIEDSLNALAKRVFQIQSFVTRELAEMKQNMDESADYIRQRRLGNATAKQKFAMTSVNNLALMLSDVLQQMQNAMQNMSGMPQKGKKGKPKPNMSLGKLQQQLNQQIQELKKSGKSGRALSEELAKLAAEQARIRKALEELENLAKQASEEEKQKIGEQIKDLKEMMEETEEKLVNKQLDQIRKDRQDEIKTRLLESEKALKERGEEEERKAEQAKKRDKRVPPSLEQYFKNKEKQIELLKTIPPALSPYYKKEVDEYFEKID